MSSSIEKEVIAMISDITGFEEHEITPDTNLIKDLDVDSIKAIEITVALEKKYKISVRDEDVPKIVSVDQAVRLVETLVNNGSLNA